MFIKECLQANALLLDHPACSILLKVGVVELFFFLSFGTMTAVQTVDLYVITMEGHLTLKDIICSRKALQCDSLSENAKVPISAL